MLTKIKKLNFFLQSFFADKFGNNEFNSILDDRF